MFARHAGKGFLSSNMKLISQASRLKLFARTEKVKNFYIIIQKLQNDKVSNKQRLPYVKWGELERKVPVKSWTLPELEKQTHGECSTRGKVWEKTSLYFNYWLSCTYIFRLRIDSAENTSFSINNWRQTISDFYLFIELTIFTFGELCCKNILKLYLDSR